MGSSKLWPGRVAACIKRPDVQALLSRRVSFLRVRRFLEPHWCAEVMRRFLSCRPPLLQAHSFGKTKTLQIGSVISSMPGREAEYFRQVEPTRRAIRALYCGGEDPLLKLQSDLSRAMGWKIETPKDSLGRRLNSDIIRAGCRGTSAPLHSDAYGNKGAPFAQVFTRHLSWNVYLSASQRGGRLIVYQRYPLPGDAAHLEPGSAWVYRSSLVSGADRGHYQARIGDLVLFDAGFYHEVRATAGATLRAAAHSYIGVNPADRAAFIWT